ncbi:MAG: hypothetical protein AAGD96_08130 [Chloroflexota bacterium]
MMHPEKYTSSPVMTANKLFGLWHPKAQSSSPPDTVLVLMHGRNFMFAQSQLRAKPIAWYPGQMCQPGWRRSGPHITKPAGVGGPAIAVDVELMATWGVKSIVLVGQAGGFPPAAKSGDIVVVQKAMRNDGVSDHYLPPEKWANPSGVLTHKILKSLKEKVSQVHTGPVWTTSAIFRETSAEVEDYAADGVLAVDMEAASLFTVANIVGVRAAAIFVISDLLKPNHHQMAPDQNQVEQKLNQVTSHLITLFD